MKEQKKKEGFGTTLGFVLACVGSAVGLGNIWLFPYRLGQYGGAAFLIPYMLFIMLFGYVGLSAEFAIGRHVRTGTLGTYKFCFKERKISQLGKFLGWIPLIGSLGIATGYAIIIGWVLRSLGGALSGELLSTPSKEYFAQSAGDFGSLPWHIIIIILTVGILIRGSIALIERINKFLIPIFFLLFAFLAIRVSFLEGAEAGYAFLFVPKWKALLNLETWIMAMGQAFFSLSITGSGMIVYGAYLSKEEDIIAVSLRTALYDTLAALLSAVAIMPAVFAFNITPTAGPALMFMTIPEIFKQMPMGQMLAVIFFLSVLFAGITSLMNMFEAVIESFQHRFKMSRKVATLICAGCTLGVGIFIENEVSVGHFMDFITIVIVPLGAVLGAISIYYVLGKGKIEKEMSQGREKKISEGFTYIARYIYVPLTVIIFILGLIYKGIG